MQMLSIFGLLATANVSVNAQTRKPAAKAATAKTVNFRQLKVQTTPAAAIWIDDVKRGKTDENGVLTIEKVSAGAHRLRVRANGFKETSLNVLPTQKIVSIKLIETKDEAELLFQQAEEARETANSPELRRAAIEIYRRALTFRPQFPEANVGIARLYEVLAETDNAQAEIEAARKSRPNYAEASAVEGRLYRVDGDDEKAIASFNRAIKEGKGFQPEAFTGLGLLYKNEENYELAAKNFEKAISQLSDSEPILYQLLGETYESAGKNAEAIKAYEKFLEAAPNSPQVSAVRSLIENLKKSGGNVPLPF